LLLLIYRVKLIEFLKPQIDANDEVNGFCNLPQSMVRIDVGNAKPVNKRQYRVAYHLQKVVDEQIAQWQDDSIVERNDKDTAWNNPILVVPKKDSVGDVKGWRVFIDPRPL
jgi:hypothetical protein